MKIFRKVLFFIALMMAFSTVCTAQATKIQFTDKEKQFINQNPVIHLCVDPEFVPYEFIDSDGVYKGIAADYIKILSERTGIQMVVEKNLPWTKAYELAVEKKLDVLPCVAKTEQREKYFLFSEPYIDFQRVIVIKKENNTIKNINDLKQTKVAVQTNSSHYSYLKSFPEIELSLYKKVDEALSAVSNGSETAYVGNLATSSYLIKEKGFTNLKYIIVDSETVQSLHFAVRNDWPELVSIINKGLASITEEEKIEINNKWIGVVNEIDYGFIFQIVALIMSFLLISVFWIIKLKKEVAKRKIIEEELRRAKAEAEAANQIKSSFLARMSHEIRTPLNTITGMAYLIQKTDINVTQKMYLEKITQASYNMLGIINDILDFSKIESGKIEFERICFNLDKLIQQVINIISFKIEEQGIGFSMSKDPKIPNYFFGDPKRIEQILINIINNAVKFTTAGEVSLAVNLAARKGSFYDLEFSIKDTGIGISKEQLDLLFTPFSQGDSSINRRFGGTGLGLSIVKSLTELMDGQVDVQSVPGGGSTFTIRLTLEVDQNKEQEDKQKAAAFYFEDVKTLVFDKSSTNLKLVGNYLESFGIPAELTTSQNKVLELLEFSEVNGKSFNLLILDHDTPKEGGVGFVENIRSNGKISSELKVIMMIPLMREDIFQKIEGLSIDLGVTKPIIPSILYNGILEIFKTNTLKQEETLMITKTSEHSKNENPYQVMVVEDNKTNQFIAKAILEEAGYGIVLTENGKEGVEYFKDHQEEIDLILMDLHMPVLNGYEASILIREMNTSVPIVAMTADAVTGIEEECNRVGINHYISKPFDPEKFLDTLAQILKTRTEEKHEAPDEKSGIEQLNDEGDILDESDGLKRIGDDVSIYRLILKEYLNENKDVVETLKNAIDRNNYPEAVQIIHKNKSGSGNIGAKKLFVIASNLQKELSAGASEETEQLVREFIVTLDKLLLEIEQKLKS